MKSLVTLEQLEDRKIIILLKGWSKEEIDLVNNTIKFIITNSMKLNITWEIKDTGLSYIFSKK
jgi:hypothetical protein